MTHILSYLAYCLGAFIFIIEEIQRNERIAKANPNPEIKYSVKVFIAEEKWNIIKIFLTGIVAVIMLPYIITGTTIHVTNSKNVEIWNLPLPVARVPIMILFGYGGGRGIIAWLGKSRKELYKKVGINQDI